MKKGLFNKNYSFWDALSWVAFAIVVIYAILKVLKIIQSPVTAGLVIVLSIVLSAAYFFGKQARAIEWLSEKNGHLKKSII